MIAFNRAVAVFLEIVSWHRVEPMPKLDLDAMDFEELWTLHEQLIQILSEKMTLEKRQLERRLARLTGAEWNCVAEVNATKRKYPKVLPKYCNPLLPTERWSGRGKKPRWLVAALEAGRKLEEFKIEDFEKRGSGPIKLV